ncbi:SRPBCC family protein [Streptomyces sp. NBC_01520]|uniref:SRPBCC family protein n=1 Tax=Streptomyces sp. NBC_01520 TaxID=2903892 RepID=UPI0038699D92
MSLLPPSSLLRFPTKPTSAVPAARHALADLDPTPFAFTRRCWVAAAPDSVYRLISDVSLTGTWSPSASGVRYAPEDGPWAGARFSGRNQRDGRAWVTQSEVVRTDPGVAFVFVVGGAGDGIVRWDWHFHGQGRGRGSVVQQSWQLLRTDPVLGDTREDVEALRDHTAESAESTLLALAERAAGHRAD